MVWIAYALQIWCEYHMLYRYGVHIICLTDMVWIAYALHIWSEYRVPYRYGVHKEEQCSLIWDVQYAGTDEGMHVCL